MGLQARTEKYMHFCKMFRMRPGHKKSKAVHYRRVLKDGMGRIQGTSSRQGGQVCVMPTPRRLRVGPSLWLTVTGMAVHK